jgi:high-affinity iron transporter
VAALTGRIATLFDGAGQELFNAFVLGLAVVLLAWHNIWMSAQGADLAAGARRVGKSVDDGQRGRSTILTVVALAVLREGSESVLFLYGLMSGGDTSGFSIATGALFGLFMGAAIGFVLYAGIVRIPMRWFFSVTSTLILLIAAGMASRIAQFLIQVDLLPGLKSPLWDLSSILPTNSMIGGVLHALAGYDASPAGMQVVFYVATVLVIVTGMWSVRLARANSTR